MQGGAALAPAYRQKACCILDSAAHRLLRSHQSAHTNFHQSPGATGKPARHRQEFPFETPCCDLFGKYFWTAFSATALARELQPFDPRRHIASEQL